MKNINPGATPGLGDLQSLALANGKQVTAKEVLDGLAAQCVLYKSCLEYVQLIEGKTLRVHFSLEERHPYHVKDTHTMGPTLHWKTHEASSPCSL